MTNRVVVGNKGGTYGMWVSKPGVDVLTAGETDMLLSTSAKTGQVLLAGSASYPGSNGTVTVNVPNYGFSPLVIAYSNKGYVSRIRWNSATQFQVTLGPTMGAAGLTGTVYWFLLNAMDVLNP